MARNPSDAEVIRRIAQSQLLDLRTTIAGEIVSYNAGTRRATVRAGVRVQAVDSDSPPEVDTLDDFEDVPVLFPSGGDFEIVWPLSAGDPVRLEFSEEDDLAFYDSTDTIPLNPEILIKHGANLVCRPEGGRGTPGTKATAIHSDGTVLKIGDDSADKYILDAEAFIGALADIFTAAAVTGADGGAALKANVATALEALASAPVPVTLTKVKGT